MVKMKFCGLSRPCDIEAVNGLRPEFIGFVFAPKSSRYVSDDRARKLKAMLNPDIKAVGVFVREEPETIAGLLNEGVIDIAQLHGGEDETYIEKLRSLTDKPIIKAFRIESGEDVKKAKCSGADYVLLDSGSGGTGETFDWTLLREMERPYFLAGGLGIENINEVLTKLHPFAVDVSSGIETGGYKDREKMAAFAAAVRKVQAESIERAKSLVQAENIV